MTALTFPRRQGHYVLLKELGRGAMGRTFLAVSREADVERICVLKAGMPGLSAPLARRFDEEALVLARLSSANVVGLYEVGSANSERFIAMEFVHGPTIEETLATCREKGIAVPQIVALLITHDLAQALHYLHTSDLKVLHRDVAAANVMLAFTGNVKLIDFGLAKSSLATDMTAPGIPHGHGAYLAPERLLGKPADARADIFSAGVILWELLTGQSANVVPGWDEGMSWKVPLPPPSAKRADLGAALDKLVRDATAIDPAGRFPDADAFRRAIAAELATRSREANTTDLAAFLGSVFGDQIAAEREEIAHLLRQARALVDADPPSSPASEPVVAQSRADPRIVELLDGKYLIQSRCGQGGMGEVYVALHHEIGRRVAIKILREAFMGQPDVVQRFKREMLAIGRINHQNVVAITDSGVTADGCLFYVMEFVEGESLKEALSRRGAFPIEEALQIAQEIAAGVEGAHALSIVHRDLKPGNVMLCARKGDGGVRAKVLDFGIAKDLRSTSATLTRLDRAVGSPDYMAPEQAEGLEIDYRSDVYAVGVVLFEMLCRQLPFVDTSPAVVINRKLNEDPPAPSSLRSEVPRAVDRLVLRALSRDPAQRPQSMKEVRVLLLEALEPLEARRHAATAPITARVARAPQSRRRVAAIVAIALGVTGLGALGLWHGRERANEASLASEPPPQASPSREALPKGSTPSGIKRRPEVVPEDPTGAPAPGGQDEKPRGSAPPTQPAPMTGTSNMDDIPTVRPSRRTVGRAAAPSVPPLQPDEAPDTPPSPAPLPAAAPSPRAHALSAAETALASGDFPSAAILAQKALDSHAPEKEARLVLGQAEFMLTRYREADEQFRRVLTIDPANAEAREGLKSVDRRLRR